MILSLFDTYLFSSNTYQKLIEVFLSALEKSDLRGKNCAAKLHEYLYIEESKGFLTEAEKLKTQMAQPLEPIAPASFTVSGRKKAFRSHLKKLTERYPDLDRVKDEYAFRIIISDKVIGSDAAIRICYLFAQTLIDSFLKKKFMILSVTAKHDGEMSEEVKGEIFVPGEIYIPEDYLPFLKDYIASPKANGYQGLHIIVRDPKTKREFEFQIRTDSMHQHAEVGRASHTLSYKPKSYMDYSRIHIPGFQYDAEKGIITEDKFGIILPLPIGDVFRHEVDGDPITWI